MCALLEGRRSSRCLLLYRRFSDTEWADGTCRHAQQTGHSLPRVTHGTSLTSVSLSLLGTNELLKLHAKAAKRRTHRATTSLIDVRERTEREKQMFCYVVVM